MSLLRLYGEVSNWKIESKLEDSSKRYFYTFPGIERISNGSNGFVIGRKGTGKTAIAIHLNNLSEANIFTHKLSFRNFAYDEIYRTPNPLLPPHSRYIDVWKTVIYLSVLKLMANNQQVSFACREELSNLELLPQSAKDAVSKSTTKTKPPHLEFKVAGTGFAWKSGDASSSELRPCECVDFLENYVLQNIDDSKYFILLDELDHGYDALTADQLANYHSMLSSLFNAIIDIKSQANQVQKKIFPILFLRTDIRDRLHDPDRSKWSDLTYELRWGEQMLKSMLAHRISRALNPHGDIYDFHTAWGLLFGTNKPKLNEIFSHIWKCSHSRPRDFIRYLQICAKHVLSTPHTPILEKDVWGAEKIYSEQFLAEIIDEARGAHPEIDLLIKCLRLVHKQQLSLQDFHLVYKRERDQPVTIQEVKAHLEMLYEYNVIGMQKKSSGTDQFFRYRHPDSIVSFESVLNVHRGLYKGLNLD